MDPTTITPVKELDQLDDVYIEKIKSDCKEERTAMARKWGAAALIPIILGLSSYAFFTDRSLQGMVYFPSRDNERQERINESTNRGMHVETDSKINYDLATLTLKTGFCFSMLVLCATALEYRRNCLNQLEEVEDYKREVLGLAS